MTWRFRHAPVMHVEAAAKRIMGILAALRTISEAHFTALPLHSRELPLHAAEHWLFASRAVLSAPSRAMLPQTSYIFDGLWRCLCPSIDAVLLAKAASGSFRRPSRPPAVRRFHTSRSTHGHHLPQKVALPPTTVDDLIKLGGNDPNHRTLHDAPTETIYEALTELRHRQSQQNKIKLLVRHLVEVRGEQPNVSLYDALVTTSWDTGGSAVILDAVMKDMKKSGIAPTVGFYHTALRVGETLSFYSLESRSPQS